MKPFALSVIGRKGAGKSEVLAALIESLTERDHKVGVIKHLARDDFEIDEPGKDTFAYRARGADKVLLAGKKRLALFANLQAELPLDELLSHFAGFDLVFLEGYFTDAIPKIEVHSRKAGALLSAALSNAVAVCSDEIEVPENRAVPWFPSGNLLSLSSWIEDQLMAAEIHV